MAKTVDDVLDEWITRGYITDKTEPNNTSYILQAKDTILAYCNIPLAADMPDGLFYVWVELAYATLNSAVATQGTGIVKSIAEGDTTVQFETGAEQADTKPPTDYRSILNRYRRMP
jgi:hypothetical protein|nr:MAG TPA: head to tail adaptor [Caudoviricetes sp.]